MNSSTIRNGTYSAAGGAALIVQSGTLDNVVVSSPLDLTTFNNANVAMVNGSVLNAVANLGKTDGTTYGRIFYGTSTTASGTMAGTGSILFGATTNNVVFNESNLAGAPGTLTIAPGILIHGISGQILNDYGPGTIVNQGTIAADVSGGTFIVNNTNGSLANQGT